MEAVERVDEGKGMSPREASAELENIHSEIKSMIGEAKRYVRWGFGGSGEVGYERAKYWISAIETALDKDHEWMGGNMFTMEDTINELNEAAEYNDEDEEYMKEEAASYDTDMEPEDFADSLVRAANTKENLSVDDIFHSEDSISVEITNDESMVKAHVDINIEDGHVTIETYRDREGVLLDSHYWEGMDDGVVEQIMDLIMMPMENTIGRRPY